MPCNRISAEWGAQRIKGLSVWATLRHALRKAIGGAGGSDIGQKDTETSLIEQFLYPKFGPGQMWEEAARRIREMGGEIRTGYAGRADHHRWLAGEGGGGGRLRHGPERPSRATISSPRPR